MDFLAKENQQLRKTVAEQQERLNEYARLLGTIQGHIQFEVLRQDLRHEVLERVLKLIEEGSKTLFKDEAIKG